MRSEPDTITLSESGGSLCVSQVEASPGNVQCWIHALEVPEGSDPTLAVRLMLKARNQAREWGYREVRANVSEPKLALIFAKHGWKIDQIILKGNLNAS